MRLMWYNEKNECWSDLVEDFEGKPTIRTYFRFVLVFGYSWTEPGLAGPFSEEIQSRLEAGRDEHIREFIKFEQI